MLHKKVVMHDDGKPEFLTIASDSMNCPKCHSAQIIKYGHTYDGKPRFKCRDCGRQFALDATRQPIDQATRQLIDKLLLERLALAADYASHRSV